MEAAQLTDLEYQINHLISAINRLKEENLTLRQKLAGNIRERTRLQQQNQQAAIKIKRVMGQLKEEIA